MSIIQLVFIFQATNPVALLFVALQHNFTIGGKAVIISLKWCKWQVILFQNLLTRVPVTVS